MWITAKAIRIGAGNETRTRDPDLGKVVLYQLSYSRINLLQPPAFGRRVTPFRFPFTAGAMTENLERETRLELATPTLARSCSTN